MNFNEEFKKLPKKTPFTKNAVQCRDGFMMSVQASKFHYCDPRKSDMEHYFSFEVGFPTEPEELLLPYAEEPNRPTETVYGWVPVAVVEQVIAKHGGVSPVIDMEDARGCTMKKFVVTVFKTEIYSTDIEVEAENEEDAIRMAAVHTVENEVPWSFEEEEIDADILWSKNETLNEAHPK